MADKVCVVIGGNEKGYKAEAIEVICDSFESACNYIRKELLLILGEEAKDWAGSCLSFQEWLDDNGYKYDLEHLPSNDDLKSAYCYQDIKGHIRNYFAIRIYEIKHYD